MANLSEVKTLTDFDLVKMSKEGDQFAFKEIVNRHKSKIAATIFGMIGRCDEADDIGQEVFIRFYNSINNFRGESALGTYLTRIAINLSLNEIKRRKRNRFSSFDKMIEEGNDVPGNVSKLFEHENSEIVNQALQKINSKYRSVLVLRLIDGYSTEETSKILNISFGTVLSRLSRGQKKLKELLKPYRDNI